MCGCCKTAGDAGLKLLSCDRELQSASARIRLAPGGIRLPKYWDPEASSTSLGGRRYHNHNSRISVTCNTQHIKPFRHGVIYELLLSPSTGPSTSLSSTLGTCLQATCCLCQTKPAILEPLHWRSENKRSKKFITAPTSFWKTRQYIHQPYF